MFFNFLIDIIIQNREKEYSYSYRKVQRIYFDGYKIVNLLSVSGLFLSYGINNYKIILDSSITLFLKLDNYRLQTYQVIHLVKISLKIVIFL